MRTWVYRPPAFQPFIRRVKHLSFVPFVPPVVLPGRAAPGILGLSDDELMSFNLTQQDTYLLFQLLENSRVSVKGIQSIVPSARLRMKSLGAKIDS